MTIKHKIQLGETKHIDAVNEDYFINISFSNKSKNINEYNIRNVLSATEIFDREREEFAVYRIYGKMEYLSMLNGINEDYNLLSDFFLPQKTGDVKTISNSFDFYLLKPATSGYTSGGTDAYMRKFEVIATPNEFSLFPAGFANNIFNEQAYTFIFHTDFDARYDLDYFNIPITEYFLYAQYQPDEIQNETMSATTWSSNGEEVISSHTPNLLQIGDIINGDLVDYNKKEFEQIVSTNQIHYIRTPYNEGNLQWKFNPFIELKLRYFSNELNRENISGDTYDDVAQIPNYATYIGDGFYVWREIMEQGISDPFTNQGVDYPFVNKKRYLFANEMLTIIPDLGHTNTNNVFTYIQREEPSTINYNITSELDNIGESCVS